MATADDIAISPAEKTEHEHTPGVHQRLLGASTTVVVVVVCPGEALTSEPVTGRQIRVMTLIEGAPTESRGHH